MTSATATRRRSARASLERPKKAGFGDYSTNAAMLLAPALGAPPREIAERLGERLSARLGDAVDRVEVAGPGFLNVFLADSWYVDAARQIVAAGADWGRGTPERARARDRRVRLGQPDRAADRRLRPSRRLRRRAGAAARALRPRGRARVLLQQRGLAGDQARRLRPGPRAQRTGARGRLPGRLRGRPGARDPRRGRARRRDARRARVGADHGAHPGDAARLPGRVRLLLPRGHAATTARSRPRTRCCASTGTPTSPRARCGCARRPSATTRTACSSARPARRPTSPPTSPTTRTRSSAASTA